MTHSVENDAPRLAGFLSPEQMFRLDMACQPIRAAFPDYGPYLVGSAMTRRDFRDVDVRCIVADDEYDRLFGVRPEIAAFLGLAVGSYLREATGLPVDFQFQRQAEANAQHTEVRHSHTQPLIGCRCSEYPPTPKPRNPLGLRTLLDFAGDTRPIPPAKGDEGGAA